MKTRISTKLLNVIRDNRTFLIVSHINPEGDAIGSCIALAMGLKKLGKSVYLLNRDPVPEILKFLPFSSTIKQKVPSRKFDVLVVVDCASVERTGLKNLRANTTLIIDHHQPQKRNQRDSSLNQSTVRFIDPNASATGEIVYRLLKALSITIDKTIALNLYTAIYTDTGGFRYSNTKSETLDIASGLIKTGVNPWQVTKEVYESLSINRLKLLALTLSTLKKDGNIAWITITKDMFKKTGTSVEDTENFVDYPRMIKDVEVAVLLREERKNLYKISLRSKADIDVEKIARNFGGGGHENASGCRINGSIKEVKRKLSLAIRNAKKH
jgi:phosphoesterase RecJ-like protein